MPSAIPIRRCPRRSRRTMLVALAEGLGDTVLAASSSTASSKCTPRASRAAARPRADQHGRGRRRVGDARRGEGRVNGWVLSAAGGAMMAPVVAVNGVDNGLSWGRMAAAGAVRPTTETIDVPAASVTAVIVYA